MRVLCVYHEVTWCTNCFNWRCLHITFNVNLVCFPIASWPCSFLNTCSSLCTLLVLHRWEPEFGQFRLCGVLFTMSTESTTDRSLSPPLPSAEIDSEHRHPANAINPYNLLPFPFHWSMAFKRYQIMHHPQNRYGLFSKHTCCGSNSYLCLVNYIFASDCHETVISCSDGRS